VRQQWLLHGDGLEAGQPEVTSQNALLRDWVAPGTVFETTVHVEDLDSVELGALLFVLRGRTGQAWRRRFHKLGGGKPLGFGSVTVEVLPQESDLRTGAQWRSWFALEADEDAGGDGDAGFDADRLVVTFLERARGGGLARALDAYEHYLRGFPRGTPVRYPADPADPDSDVDRYEWFVRNREGAKRSLGRLEAGYQDLKLPTDPVPEQPPGDRRRGAGHRGGR
jgi:hypothetical protein